MQNIKTVLCSICVLAVDFLTHNLPVKDDRKIKKHGTYKKFERLQILRDAQGKSFAYLKAS
jgi:hypothetical protein